MTGNGDAAGRYARGQFDRAPCHAQPDIVPVEGDPVTAALQREIDLSTLERLTDMYPIEALQFVIETRRRALEEQESRP